MYILLYIYVSLISNTSVIMEKEFNYQYQNYSIRIVLDGGLDYHIRWIRNANGSFLTYQQEKQLKADNDLRDAILANIIFNIDQESRDELTEQRVEAEQRAQAQAADMTAFYNHHFWNAGQRAD